MSDAGRNCPQCRFSTTKLDVDWCPRCDDVLLTKAAAPDREPLTVDPIDDHDEKRVEPAGDDPFDDDAVVVHPPFSVSPPPVPEDDVPVSESAPGHHVAWRFAAGTVVMLVLVILLEVTDLLSIW